MEIASADFAAAGRALPVVDANGQHWQYLRNSVNVVVGIQVAGLHAHANMPLNLRRNSESNLCFPDCIAFETSLNR
jgi:hypothetical protein